MMMGHAPPHYAKHIEAQGYSKAMDLYAYRYYAHQTFPPGPTAIVKRAARNAPIKRRFLDKANYQADLDIVLDIFNDAWSDNWGFVPFTTKFPT